MADHLPVREMVLYKHGVGFFVRQGEIEGENVALNFRKDEINDVLKSLAVFDQGGGQILGIHYQTPMDRQARLASSSIKLSHTGSLRDLIRDLRGRDVTVQIESTPGTLDNLQGRVIGLDDPVSQQAIVENPPLLVTLLTEGGVRVFSLNDLRNITIQDAQSEHDLSYFLDTSMAEDDRRTVSVRLSEGAHDLVVYYVAPSPTWRVSYRLVAESDEAGNTGTATLQGWGLFDNRLDEDLNDVRVTLVAGQPISFIYDLYTSRIPQRRIVKEEGRIAPGPVEYEATRRKAAPRAFGARAQMDTSEAMLPASPSPEVAASSFAAPPPMSRDQMQEEQAEGKATGETFQYGVTAPVTVKRGESALVPILTKEIKYERELLYNRAKFADHPVAALRFENATGLTLERGPVTVVEDGDYRGDAMVPFTQESNPVYLPYAVELGVRVTETQADPQEITVGIHIADRMMHYDVYRIHETQYRIENNTEKAKTVTIEAPNVALNNMELYEMPAPDDETAREQRWHIDVNANASELFIHKRRHIIQRTTQIEHLQYDALKWLRAQDWLDDTTYEQLRGIIDARMKTHKLQQQINADKKQRAQTYEQQEQIRKNLGALQTKGKEATLRDRLLQQLEESQDRVDALNQRMETNQAQIDTLRKQMEEILAALG